MLISLFIAEEQRGFFKSDDIAAGGAVTFCGVVSPGGGKVCGKALQGKTPAQSAQGLAYITFYRGRTAGFFKSDDVAAGGAVAFCGVVSPGGGKVCGKALQSKTPAQSAQGLAYITFYRGRTAGFFKSDDVAAGGAVTFCGVVSPGGGKVCGKALQGKTPAPVGAGVCLYHFLSWKNSGIFSR